MNDGSATPPPHRMHLRGPWEFAWIQGFPATENHEVTSGELRDKPAVASSKTGRVKLPADWRDLFGQRSGTIRWRRRFGRPTNLEPQERVYVAFDGVGGSAQVSVNGSVLGTIENSSAPIRFDITPLLKANNMLEVELTYDDHSTTPGGLWAPVAIEIHQ